MSSPPESANFSASARFLTQSAAAVADDEYVRSTLLDALRYRRNEEWRLAYLALELAAAEMGLFERAGLLRQFREACLPRITPERVAPKRKKHK